MSATSWAKYGPCPTCGAAAGETCTRNDTGRRLTRPHTGRHAVEYLPPRRGHNEPTHQPERVIVGHCPTCERVVVLFNNRETWALVVCACGWAGDTTSVKNRQRLDRGGYIEGDPAVDERSAR